jgi:hypothetical protein
MPAAPGTPGALDGPLHGQQVVRSGVVPSPHRHAPSLARLPSSRRDSRARQPTKLLRGWPKSVASQASELRKHENGITPFDCPRDKTSRPALRGDRLRRPSSAGRTRYAGTMRDRRDHQLYLRSGQDETVVFKLWPLLLDVMLPGLTHAEIDVLPDCDARLPIDVPPEVRRACETIRDMAAAEQKREERRRFLSWLFPRMLRLDPSQPEQLELLRIFGPYVVTEVYAEGEQEYVLCIGDVPTDLQARLTDTEAAALRTTMRVAGLEPRAVLEGL